MEQELSNIYLVTDQHIGHTRIVTDFGFRVANYEALLATNWTKIVKNQDIVIDLGDVCWSNKEYLKNILTNLPGTKILVRGNHDICRSDNWFLDAGYSAVFEKVTLKNIILSHKPTVFSAAENERKLINIHGHFHDMPSENWEPYLKERITDRHYLFSLERVNYKPILLQKAVQKKLVLNSLDLMNGK